MNEQSKEKDSEGKKQLENIWKIVTILVGAYSLFSVGICNFISMGRVEYFDFDLQYFEYSLSYVTRGVLFLFISSLIVGGIIAVALITIGIYLKINNKSMKWQLLYFLITTPLGGVIIFFLFTKIMMYIKLAISLAGFATMIFILVYTIIIMFWTDEKSRNKYTFIAGGILLGITLLATIYLKEVEYNDAKNQKIFEIIRVNEIIEDKQYQYVVISSSSKRHSAYLCEIIKRDDTIELLIFENVHKYFECSVIETVALEFENIHKEKIPYSEMGIMYQEYEE